MSRPTLDRLLRHAPQLAAIAADTGKADLGPADALDRLPTRYFAAYDEATIARHVELLCSISTEEPYALDARRSGDRLELTLATVDDPGMLSLLTGTLGAAGLDIESGEVFTMRRSAEQSGSGGTGRRRARHSRYGVGRPILPTRRILDRFVGTLRPGFSPASFFATLTAMLDRVISLILPGGDREEARRIVNEAVADRLRSDTAAEAGALYPLEIRFESDKSATRMIITGEDTPFFLYALSAALSLQRISIESVSIQTSRHVISDTFELVDSAGEPITDASELDRVRFSVLLTKQFTYFLDRAPDPYAALTRFEQLSRDLVGQAEHGGIDSLLTRPFVLRELAQLLGASDFLWEDFIRLQYENIIPLLDDPRRRSASRDELEERLRGALAGAAGDERVRILNEFKDREAFLIDLDHILHTERDFFFLSNRLTDLAELIIRVALEIAWDDAIARYGRPRTVAGLETAWAVFGLGKLGGRALGYASDIELLFVYRDAGTTDGPRPIPNAEFFERFFTEAAGAIESKREGIFQVDLRLRPYGNAGPHAVSLESFNRYYGRGGDAHSYERLALTRLRFVAGNREFGRSVEDLRDDLLYAADSIDLREIRTLRERQFHEKASAGRQNAKFSPGGLVDLEYGLQILLVQHGRTNPRLRTPSLHAGLEELERSGLMEPGEAGRLVRAYRFLRNLINGLRMLRGNAQDLFLPPVESLEYAHLARRAGYEQDGELSAAEQLHVEFEARTAAVRTFLERHLGRESIPGPRPGNAADLILGREVDAELASRILDDARLSNHVRARANLEALAGEGDQRELASELIILVWQALRSNGDPDRALNTWQRYVERLDDPCSHYRGLLRQPRMLDLMLQVFATSSFLSETLIRDPESLNWALDSRIVGTLRGSGEMLIDLRAAATGSREERRRLIRLRRRREILRIGTRDICLKAPLSEVTAELSSLARAIIAFDLERIWDEMHLPTKERERFVVLAFGKLGGHELNYSSDVDLLGIYADGDPTRRETDQRRYTETLTRLRSDLSDHTVDGYAYRVDFRLRPYGSAGPLVQPLSAVLRYYERTASAWEHQALLKLSPVAGALSLGEEFLERVKPSFIDAVAREDVRETIARLRAQAVRRTAGDDDVKSGEGGIRDIEFLVQGLQMIHCREHPAVLTGNTLEALERLRAAGRIADRTADELADDYRRLRRIEHFLQMHEDRQVHSIPSAESERAVLARRLDGPRADATTFLDDLTRRRTRVRAHFHAFLDGNRSDEPTQTRSDE